MTFPGFDLFSGDGRVQQAARNDRHHAEIAAELAKHGMTSAMENRRVVERRSFPRVTPDRRQGVA